MQTKNWFYILIILVGFFTSCEVQEKPIVSLRSPGEVITEKIDLETDYRYQKFYSLEDTSVVSTNLKTDWDLGFQSDPQGWVVKLNMSCAMQADRIPSMDSEVNIQNAKWKWDEPSQNLDSTALGDWRDYDGAYLIDRGFTPEGSRRGYIKLRIIESDAHSYTFEWMDTEERVLHHQTIQKQNGVNFTCFSIDKKEVVNVEPEQTTWDLVFTQYLHIFREELDISVYLVTGVLGNPYSTQFTMDTLRSFNDIDREYAMSLTYSTDMNRIGYDWKEYRYDAGSYIILYQNTYLIKKEDEYYKMKFIDFYNDLGEKGVPTFELQKL